MSRTDDAGLWRLAVKDVKAAPKRYAAEAQPPVSPLKKTSAPAPSSPSLYESFGVQPPAEETPLPETPLSPFGGPGKKAYKALKRGKTSPEALLDLHGMDRRAAYMHFSAFVRRKRMAGVRTALVVTGKSDRSGGVGVLRSELPLWIAAPELREHISGYDVASQKHGGDGAFYLFLRRI